MKAQRIRRTYMVTNTGLEQLEILTNELEKHGYKQAHGRCPNGCTYIIDLYCRRWCGEWSGYQTFKTDTYYLK